MNLKFAVAVLSSTALFLSFHSASSFAGEPRLQPAPTKTPTEEPTKPPYVFPTPIFIPTYPIEEPIPTQTIALPTSAQTYVVEPGDYPSAIAKKFYGDASKYPLIMNANNIIDPRKLRVGAVLIIPPLSPSQQPTPAPVITSPAASTLANIPGTPSPSSTLRPNLLPAQSLVPSSPSEIVLTIATVLSAIFLLGFIVMAILAFLVYRHSRLLQDLAKTSQRFLGRK